MNLRPGIFPRRGRFIAAVMCVLFVAPACSNGEDAKDNTEASNQPPAQVNLPDPPPASAFDIPEKNDDGTLRVEGLLQFRDKYLGQPVRVKGVITYVSEDCDPKRAKRRGEECPEPNMYIRDSEEAEKQLLVVGYKPEFAERVKLDRLHKKGEPHVFEGTYKKLAQGFVASEDGLLLLDKLDDTDVIEPE